MTGTKRLLLRAVLSLLIFNFSFLICHAQQADAIEALLASDAVSYSQAAWLILDAANISGMDEGAAFSYASERGWVPKNAEAGTLAKLDGVSLLIMGAFGMKGGIFYSLAKNPRYAYRELAYLNIIQGRVEPHMAVSGDLLLYLTGKVLERYE